MHTYREHATGPHFQMGAVAPRVPRKLSLRGSTTVEVVLRAVIHCEQLILKFSGPSRSNLHFNF